MTAGTGGRTVDFGRVADDYIQFRGEFPPAFFDRLARLHHIGLAGQAVLDVGTGTGALARAFALRGCRVTALDPSDKLLDRARATDRDAPYVVDYVNGTAESTGLEPSSFDVVTAGRCWHWFDRSRAAGELRRVLFPGGALVIAHFDRVRSRCSVLQATDALIARRNPGWMQGPPFRFGGGIGIYPEWVRDVASAGFQDIETFSFDVAVPYTHEQWRGRVRTGGGVGASLAASEVAALDQELAALLTSEFPNQPLLVTHRVFAVVCRSPGQNHLGGPAT